MREGDRKKGRRREGDSERGRQEERETGKRGRQGRDWCSDMFNKRKQKGQELKSLI